MGGKGVPRDWLAGQAEVGLLNDSSWVGEEEWSRQEEQEQRLLSPRLLLFPNPLEVQGP